jgi:hypothetical protein
MFRWQPELCCLPGEIPQIRDKAPRFFRARKIAQSADPNPVTKKGTENTVPQHSYEICLRALDEQNNLNRRAVFETLELAGITSLAINFNVIAATPRVQHLKLLAGQQPVALPAAMVRVFSTHCFAPASHYGEVTLHQAIEGVLRDSLDLMPDDLPDTPGMLRMEIAERQLKLSLEIQPLLA